MKIFFYPPFKPLDHPNPSGDLVTARGLVEYLQSRGHEVTAASRLRTRWMYWKPGMLPQIRAEKRRVLDLAASEKPDLWLTYHSYYKAPDLLGPGVCKALNLPYAIFQGIYSTKHKRRIKTMPGFHLNRLALKAADHIFANRREDLKNLRRLIAPSRLSYIRPGIKPGLFAFDEEARVELRKQWGAEDKPVVLSAAMFRADVKTQGLLWVIRACGILKNQGLPFKLAIAGDGRERRRIEQAAEESLGEDFILLGKIPRDHMNRVYSAGDVFAFPGFNETLGMVYLEAQSCGLPIVACHNGGIPEVMIHGRTGFLTPLGDLGAYVNAMKDLLVNPEKRAEMGARAASYVRSRHDLDCNYSNMEDILNRCIREHYERQG
ncbi:Glycosyltransferase involved in cell wall bisynthesis [Desulfatibacillum alkenivorans DSM 16219]|jgi:glycosyltransferase involved in cell wall biosynthesis|uniref:Glycosyltransferase involved in cell wall bisynthesis n=1 Tax=Desulfatibacillum alkenivorans DSM 16219 TaxID=1121393 RepID=A0A1M6PD81_9BACT|nr:glycosyltransferase family 4 protein [Desulfatibacillum alkenivorans]SHK05903.1 Glycosyltransferase involved in cell wall bisynthesis [Desulfatibacillum alkenivorans DSM 16219]